MTLPAGTDFYHSFTLRMDYKFRPGRNLATGEHQHADHLLSIQCGLQRDLG